VKILLLILFYTAQLGLFIWLARKAYAVLVALLAWAKLFLPTTSLYVVAAFAAFLTALVY